MAEEHDYLVIGHDFRTIEIPESEALLGVENDKNVNTLYFRAPRIYDSVDLLDYDFQINYMNAALEGDIYYVEDKAFDSETGAITFSWLVGQSACRYAGDVRFIVRAINTDAQTGEILNEYHTTVHSLPVLEGLSVDIDTEDIDTYDIVQQLIYIAYRAGMDTDLASPPVLKVEDGVLSLSVPVQ